MIGKIICLVPCAILIFACYRAKFVAEKILKKENPSDKLLLNIKTAALIAASLLFIAVMILFKNDTIH